MTRLKSLHKLAFQILESICKNGKSKRDNIIDHGLPRLAPLKPTKKTKNIELAHAHQNQGLYSLTVSFTTQLLFLIKELPNWSRVPVSRVSLIETVENLAPGPCVGQFSEHFRSDFLLRDICSGHNHNIEEEEYILNLGATRHDGTGGHSSFCINMDISLSVKRQTRYLKLSCYFGTLCVPELI